MNTVMIARVTSQVGDISDQLDGYKLLQKGPVRQTFKCVLFNQYKIVRMAVDRYKLILHVSWKRDCMF